MCLKKLAWQRVKIVEVFFLMQYKDTQQKVFFLVVLVLNWIAISNHSQSPDINTNMPANITL
jgi:hypothetical protein